MKQIFTLSFLLFSLAVFSQQKTTAKQQPAANTKTEQAKPQTQSSTPAAENPRTTATSVQVRSSEPAKLLYDPNDKYMGRKEEFLGNLTVTELPADFPVYEKQWNLSEYNQVVTAFYYNHPDIVKESVKAKLAHLEH